MMRKSLGTLSLEVIEHSLYGIAKDMLFDRQRDGLRID